MATRDHCLAPCRLAGSTHGLRPTVRTAHALYQRRGACLRPGPELQTQPCFHVPLLPRGWRWGRRGRAEGPAQLPPLPLTHLCQTPARGPAAQEAGSTGGHLVSREPSRRPNTETNRGSSAHPQGKCPVPLPILCGHRRRTFPEGPPCCPCLPSLQPGPGLPSSRAGL